MKSTAITMTASTTGAVSSGRKKRPRQFAVAVLAAGFIFVAAVAAGGSFGGLRFNLTPSEPLGLWRVVSLDRPAAVGDLVFVCPPQAIAAFGLERGYFRWGSCPSGVAPLIKTVAATTGAHIVIGDEVEIDGAPLLHSRLSSRDGAGRPLVPWSGGVVPAGWIFLHSPFAGSYDSRYFGPVPEAGLLGLARPLLTVDP